MLKMQDLSNDVGDCWKKSGPAFENLLDHKSSVRIPPLNRPLDKNSTVSVPLSLVEFC